MATKKKPLNPKMMVKRNSKATPVPMPKGPERTYPKGIKPAPMPTRVPNLSLPPDQRAKAKVMPSGPKKKTPATKTPIFQMPKKKTSKKTSPMPKARNKKVPAPMPTTKSGDINPFKMTPQQKQEYLRNPERYSRG
jgi:hypothetical protein